MEHSTTRVLAALESHGCKLSKSGAGWKSRCPSHNGASESLSIDTGDNGAVLLHCFSGCTFEAVLHSLGLDQANGDKRIVASYDYDGFFETVRYSPKGFKQRRKTAAGEWVWNLKGVRAAALPAKRPYGGGRVPMPMFARAKRMCETLRGQGIHAGNVTNQRRRGQVAKALHTEALVAAGVASPLLCSLTADEAGRAHGQQGSSVRYHRRALRVKVCRATGKRR